MKQFKQLAALFLAFAMVIGVFSTPTVAFAATTTLTESNITVNYVDEQIEVTKGASDVIYFTDSYKANTTWEKAYAEKNATKAVIDFSFTSATKETIIYVTNDKAKEPIEVKLVPQETTLAVALSGTADTTVKSKIKLAGNWEDIAKINSKYTGTNTDPWAFGFLCFSVGKGSTLQALTKAQVETNIEWRKGTTGAWQTMDKLNLASYSVKGAQLYFRVKANNTVSDADATLKVGRTGKEVKLSYAKQANAPKITIDGATKKINLTKTQEYRTCVNGTYGEWIKVADAHMENNKLKTIYLKDLQSATGSAWSYNEATDKQSIEVRIAASDKSVASKIAKVELNAVATPDFDDVATMTLVKATTYAKGMKITNVTTGTAIQVAVVSGSPVNVNDKKAVKWININGAKSTTIKEAVLNAGDRILVRYAAVKDNKSTPANEFAVSSDYATIAKSAWVQPAVQSLNYASTATVNKVVATADVTATVASAGGLTTVTVANTASASALTITLNATTSNVADCSPKITCVKEATLTSEKDTAKAVKLGADGKFTANQGKLKISITKDAATETKIFKVDVDGYVHFIKVVFTKTGN